MIEFKGTYFNETGAGSQIVLVQFDGVLLHIWHLSDPFYRLLSSDVFHLAYRSFGGQHRIKLPNGGCIETEDHDAVIMLRKKHQPLTHRLMDRRKLVQGLFALLLGIFIFIGTWLILI